jgi:hypothetical protein
MFRSVFKILILSTEVPIVIVLQVLRYHVAFVELISFLPYIH